LPRRIRAVRHGAQAGAPHLVPAALLIGAAADCCARHAAAVCSAFWRLVVAGMAPE